MAESREALIASYLESLPRLRAAVADMTSEQLRARPIPGKWSVLEVVCHLVDSDQTLCHRMKRAIAEEKPLLIGFDADRFAAGLSYHDADVEEELNLMEAMRREMARVLRSLPESAWSRSAVHSQRGLLTLEQLARLAADHVPHHLAFILEKRKALRLPA